MKNYLLFLFCLMAAQSMVAQKMSSSDASLLKKYIKTFEENKNKKEITPAVIFSLKKAEEIYNRNPEIFDLYEIKIKGLSAINAAENNRATLQLDSLIMALKSKTERSGIEDNNPAFAFLYTAAAVYHLHENELRKAIEFFEKAFPLVEKPSANYFRLLEVGSIGYTNLIVGNKFEPYLTEMEEILKNNEEYNEELVNFNLYKINYYNSTGAFERTLSHALEGLRLNEKYGNPYPAPFFSLKVVYGYLMTGNYEEAEKLLLEIVEQTDISDYSVQEKSDYLSTVAFRFQRLGDSETAGKYYLDAVRYIEESTLTDYQDDKRILYGEVAAFYMQNYKFEESKKYLEKAISIEPDIESLSTYGQILSILKDHDKALIQFKEGLKMLIPDFKPQTVYENPSSQQISEYIEVSHLFYFLIKKSNTLFNKVLETEYQDESLIIACEETCREALFVVKNNLETLEIYDFDKFARNSRYIQIFNILKALEYHRTAESTKNEELFDLIERKKGLNLLEVLTKNQLPQQLLDEKESIVDEIFLSEKNMLLSSDDSLEYHSKKLAESNKKWETFYTALQENTETDVSNYFNIDYSTVADIQNNLDAETVFIEYSYDLWYRYFYIFVITDKETKKLQFRYDRSILKDMKNLNNLLQNPLIGQVKNKQAFIEISNRLYTTLIEPIKTEIEDKKRLMIVPEGELFYTPFEVLFAATDSRSFEDFDYLVKDYEINYHYSVTIYSRLSEKEKYTDNSLLAFAPVFTEGKDYISPSRSLVYLTDTLYRESVNDGNFTPLPASEQEVKEIANLTTNAARTELLIGKDATERNLSDKLSGAKYRFVHLATHGLTNYNNPKLSGMACYQTNSGQDGILFSSEVQRQKIQADLIVLSSCDSGIGKMVSGEGLIALNRSFIYAGAKNVLFSLWKVNDTYTKDLMVDFYQNVIEKEEPYTSALRSAKLKMIADPATASPRYWAPFILMGE